MLDISLDRKYNSVFRRRVSGLILCALGLVITSVIVPSVIVPSVSYSQDAASSGSGNKSQKRTTINFEDQLIEGRTQKPELFVLLQNRMNNSRRLFKLRENFLPEMRKTAVDVGRAESNVRGSAEPVK